VSDATATSARLPSTEKYVGDSGSDIGTLDGNPRGMGTPTSPDEITQYNFIICGSGTSASDLARCLAETADVRVLLLTGAESENHWVPASLTMNALASQEDSHAGAPSQSLFVKSCIARDARQSVKSVPALPT
jgi:hypothetical protein